MLADVLVTAAVYVMLAAGYVIVYRASRVLNFAYAEIFMTSAYLGFTIVSALSLHPLMTFPVAIGLGAIAGVAVYFVLMAPMAGQPVFAAVLVTIGLGIILRALVAMTFTAQIIFPGRLLRVDNAPLTFHGVTITRYGLVIVVTTALLMIALLAFFRYSRLGIQMRAASSDARLAAFRGMNIHRLFATAWGMALAIAGVAGGLYGMNYQIGIEIVLVGIKGLVVALVGGMDSLSGALPAGLLVATIEILVQRYVDPQLSEIIPFLVLLVVLLVRPWGLLGTREIIDRV
jgi:branched-chain amino acid transport system permease protein